MPDSIILKHHQLKHIKELRVGNDFFAGRFQSECSMGNCRSSCCSYGVFADLRERDNILAHAKTIRRHLEPHQEHDPSKWFDEGVIDDADFPSGKAAGTRANERGCVFLDSAGRCALQKTAVAEGMHKFALKPFFCVAFPVTLDHGRLILDSAEFANKPECCGIVQKGSLTAFDVCAEELEFMLGARGYAELLSLKPGASPVPSPADQG
jgi:hypothetical protein